MEATRHPTEVSPARTAARSAPVSSAVVPSKTQLSQHKDQGVAQRKQQDQWKTKDPRHQERRTDLPRSRDQRRDPRDRDRDLDWLVGCYGFNGPLRQYLSLYRAVPQREGRGEKG